MADDSYLDISDHDSFKSGVPHKTFERLRNEEPIFWTKENLYLQIILIQKK